MKGVGGPPPRYIPNLAEIPTYPPPVIYRHLYKNIILQKKKDTLPKVAQQNLPELKTLKTKPTRKNEKTIPKKVEEQTQLPILLEQKKKPIVFNEGEAQVDSSFFQKQTMKYGLAQLQLYQKIKKKMSLMKSLFLKDLTIN